MPLPHPTPPPPQGVRERGRGAWLYDQKERKKEKEHFKRSLGTFKSVREQKNLKQEPGPNHESRKLTIKGQE